MKKLLFVTTIPPAPATSGGRQRTFTFLQTLRHAFQVTLLLPDSPELAECLPIMEELDIQVISGLPRSNGLLTWSDGYFRDYPWHFASFVEAVEGDFDRIAGDFDYIYIDHLHMTPIILDKEFSAKLLLDEHNIEGKLFFDYALAQTQPRRFFLTKYAKSISRFEKSILRKFNLLLVPTREEREAAINMGCDPSRVIIIPNGAKGPSSLPPASQQRRILYTGALDWAPNLVSIKHFTKKVYLPLKRQYPELEFIIAGHQPDANFQEYCRKREIILLADYDDAYSIYELANIVIVPSIVSGGMKIKAAEGLLYGRHVVSTHNGASGLPHLPYLHRSTLIDGFLPILDELLTSNQLPQINPADVLHLDWKNIQQHFVDKVIQRLL